MKKQLHISWDGVNDATGYLFSLAKSLSCAVRNSPYAEYAEDIVATSGFAFRMWVAADLCPSATSIWEFGNQKRWVENGGLLCDYVGRYWGEDHIEEERRLEAIAMIRKSIDNGNAAISWDVAVPEWGLITGYDDEAQMFSTLAINAKKADPTSPATSTSQMPYAALGKRELPILSVLTVKGKAEKPAAGILHDTMKLAAYHLKGKEWGDNAKGLAAYPALIRHFEADDKAPARSWQMEYMLGTYGALKYYAWKYLEKMQQGELSALYKGIYDAWIEAFRTKTTEDMANPAVSEKIAGLLRCAEGMEKKALEIMEG